MIKRNIYYYYPHEDQRWSCVKFADAQDTAEYFFKKDIEDAEISLEWKHAYFLNLVHKWIYDNPYTFLTLHKNAIGNLRLARKQNAMKTLDELGVRWQLVPKERKTEDDKEQEEQSEETEHDNEDTTEGEQPPTEDSTDTGEEENLLIDEL